MKKLFFFFIMFFSLYFLQEVSAETIKMGFFEIKPHLYEDKTSKKPDGASIKFFDEIASKMGYHVEWIGPLPFLRLIQNLKDGTIDGSVLLTKSNERTDYLYYSDSPYHLVQSIFVLKKDNKLEKITSIDDVKGYSVGCLKGINQTKFVKDNTDKLTLDYLHGDTWASQNLNRLVAGKIDAVYDLNSHTLLFEAKLLKLDDQIKILSLPEPPVGVYSVFSKKSEKGQMLLQKYNEIVKESNLNYSDFLEKEFKKF
jgi:polar amino acid transport system substrate-binding protein